QDEIDKAVREAEQYAAEDVKRKEEAEVRNQADQMVYQCEKILDEMKDKIDPADKASVEEPLNRVKEALKGNDIEAIKAANEELTKAFYAVSEKIYGQAGGAEGAAPDGDAGAAPGGEAPNGGEYYDADYKVVDDDQQ
ncbi:MAG: Hsp70 family protein, partial [Oscillospiraceae bacterium]|nr:Hsp70 family protein [Oscillospiraceae bacterium]